MAIKVKEAYRPPNQLNQKIKSPDTKNKEQILKVAMGKGQVTCKGRPIRITPDLSRDPKIQKGMN